MKQFWVSALLIALSILGALAGLFVARRGLAWLEWREQRARRALLEGRQECASRLAESADECQTNYDRQFKEYQDRYDVTNKAFGEGVDASARGEPETSNPYTSGQKFDPDLAWAAGWSGVPPPAPWLCES